MTAVLGFALEDDVLRRAFRCADEVHEMMKHLQKPTVTNQLMLELAAVALDAVQCIEQNIPLHTSHLPRISLYLPKNEKARSSVETPLVKIAYALTAVIEQLMNERLDQVPSTSNEQIFNSPDLDPLCAEADKVEVKTEPVEVKEEPLDYVEDVKLEEPEEPLADVFCPTTGTARPFEPADFEARDEEMPELDRHFPSTIVARPIPNILKRMPHLNKRVAPEESSPVRGPKILNRKRVAPVDPTLVPGPSRPLVTAPDELVHVSSAPRPPRSAPTIPDDVITSNDYHHVSNGMTIGQTLQQGIALPFIGAQCAGPSCYLCGKYPAKWEAIPPHYLAKKRLDFINRIIVDDSFPAQKLRVHQLRSNRDKVSFCMAHMAVPLVPDGTKTKDLVAKTQTCDLCEQPHLPFSLSPVSTARRQKFFTNVLLNTPVQISKVSWFIKNPQETAVICAKHFKKQPLLVHDKKIIRDSDEYVPIAKRLASRIEAGVPLNARDRPRQAIALPRATPVRVDVGCPKDEKIKEEVDD